MTGGIETVFVGCIVHSKSLTELEVIENGLLGLTAEGKVAFLQNLVGNRGDLCDETLQNASQTFGFDISVVQKLTATQFLLPGFVSHLWASLLLDNVLTCAPPNEQIDTHIHAPQYVFTGTGCDLPLLQWLEKYTFPREQAFSDPTYAQSAYQRAVTRTLRNGTTTAAYYATIHSEATKILATICAETGQRAFIGKVCMDRNSPSTYIESTEDSLKTTNEVADFISQLSTKGRVKPIITPRFAASCTSELMHGLANIAKKRDLPIQTHLSESHAEIEMVEKLHPECSSYTAVYADHGLLTNKTVLAHCVHLSPSERKLVYDANAGVAHCPNSNFSILSGVCNVRRLLQEGIKVGLGTDVAGGYSASMMDAMRQAVIASKVTFMNSRDASKDGRKPWQPLNLGEVLYLATLGGAKVLGVDGVVGNFEVGKEFDAVLVDLKPGDGRCVDVFGHDGIMDSIEKFVYNGDDRNIAKVWVGGRQVL
ncbi:hypothetical protein HK097_000084 [Rhizophlyctis rosea]|uniref:Guanine deaminase n=1 Tax=Rhizophlyctis rosea TaxID=64517 RepID=A0AAD5SHY5_9FUNG|nr:hypothetical protein HK097_000084 [Rhizophlyctis rosea]